MIDGIDESQADISVVVGDENNVKELLTLRIKVPQLSVDCLQGLGIKPNQMCVKLKDRLNSVQ